MYKLQCGLSYIGLRDYFRYRLILMVLCQILAQVSEIDVEDLAMVFENFWISCPLTQILDDDDCFCGFNYYDEGDIYRFFGLEIIVLWTDKEMEDMEF